MRTPTAFFGILLLIFLAFLSFSALESPQEHPSAPTTNPAERIKWETERLKDPSTGELPIDIRRNELAFAEQMKFAAKSKGRASNIWERVGPDTLGGRTRALAIDVTDEDILVAGAISGGLWRSTDGGQSWVQTLNSTQQHNISALAQDPREGKTNIWYAGTGEFRGNSASGGGAPYRGDGIYKSTDGANSWTLLESTSTALPQFFDQDMDYVWRIVVDATNESEDEVYAAVYSGIYRSIDGGASWSEVLGGRGGQHFFTDVVISPTGVLYAALSNPGDNAGVWRSEDGINWVDITPQNWSTASQRTTLAIAPSNEDVVYTATYSPGAGTHDHSLWKYTHIVSESDTLAGVWEDRSANVPGFGSFSNNPFDSNENYDLLISVKPDDEEIVFLGGTSLYRSLDGFRTSNTAWVAGYAGGNDNWSGAHHADQHIVVYSPSDPNIMYTGSDGGIHRTLDNSSSTVFWQSLNDGYVTSQFHTLTIDHTSPNSPAIQGGTQDNGTWIISDPSVSIQGEKLWGGDGGFGALLNDGLLRYASFQRGRIYRLKYDALGRRLSWALATPSLESNYLFIHPFILDPNDSNIMYLPGNQRLLRNTNLSGIPDFQSSSHTIGWQELTNTFIDGDGVISSVEASRANPAHRVYFGTSGGRVYRVDDAHTGDPIAIDITSANFPPGAYVSSITVHPEDANQVAIAFSNYNVQSIFFSDDAGGSWTNISGTLEENENGTGNGPSVRWIEIAVIPGTVPMFFVGTSTGLYSASSLDGAQTQWIQEGSDTIGNVVIEMLDVRHRDGFVAVGTHGTGFFKSNLPVPILEAAPGGIASNLKLWLKADEGITEDSLVSNWADQSVNSNDASQDTPTHQPTFVPDALNFNPAVNFDGNLSGDGGGDYLESTEGYYDQSVFIVFTPDGTIRPKDPNAWTTAQQLIGADAERNLAEDFNGVTGVFIGDGWGGNSSEVICLFSDANIDGAIYNACYENSADSLLASEPLLLSFNELASNDGKAFYRNGIPLNVTQGPYEEMINTPYRLGNDWDSAEITTDDDSERGEGSFWFNGDIAEVILYANRLDDLDREKIESYLAIKYGLTLGHNYIASDGTILWDLSASTGYNTGIAGIGRDDASSLHQKQSLAGILSIGIDTLTADNASNPNTFTEDGSFLMWGHNDEPVTETPVMFGASDAQVLKRTWFVQKTGTVDSVDLQFDLSQLDITGTEASDFWLVQDSDTDPFSDHRIMIQAAIFSEGKVYFNNVQLEDNDYLTLVTDNPDDVQLPVELAHFDAFMNEGTVHLTWTTHSESNNAGFEVQRSEGNQEKWFMLGFIDGQGHSSRTIDYSIKDNLTNITESQVTYRLKQIDFDGSFTYSEEISLQIPAPNTYTITGYPNPFNPVATIEYRVPTDSHVKVSVYDIQGRQVMTLVDDQKPAGRYTAVLDGTSLASGIYVYTLETGSQVISKTLTLLK